MAYEATIIADSISPQGVRLTTFQLVYPRYIHAEVMTHRVFSRNASSSRAIPVKKLAQLALDEMVYPIRWGKNQPGMQAANEDLSDHDRAIAGEIWNGMAEACARGAAELAGLGLHKQWANRPLEWFSNIRVVLTTTDLSNWDELRYHPDAQPEIYELARVMREAAANSAPKLLMPGEWHLPYVLDTERAAFSLATLKKISTARCARVSYLTHDGKMPSPEKDIGLYMQLVGSRPLHASPAEHQATPDTVRKFLPSVFGKYKRPELHGNLTGWCQHRKQIEQTLWKKAA